MTSCGLASSIVVSSLDYFQLAVYMCKCIGKEYNKINSTLEKHNKKPAHSLDASGCLLQDRNLFKTPWSQMVSIAADIHHLLCNNFMTTHDEAASILNENTPFQ